jgi:hypothetical protein
VQPADIPPPDEPVTVEAWLAEHPDHGPFIESSRTVTGWVTSG